MTRDNFKALAVKSKHCMPPKSAKVERCGDEVKFVCDGQIYLCAVHVIDHEKAHGRLVKPYSGSAEEAKPAATIQGKAESAT